MLTRIVTLAFCFAARTAVAAPMTVIVDPGHGGKDDGATRAGHSEADITLKVSELLAEKLRRDRDFRVHLTRDADQSLTLSERARVAKAKSADVFISIHVNSNPDTKARGAEFYFQNQLPPDEESMYLAHRENSADAATGRVPYAFLDENELPPDVNSIVSDLLDGDRVWRSSQLAKALKSEWRGSKKSKTNSIRQAPFYVLSQMSTPSSLVELGFLTNAGELTELLNPETQKRMAEDLYRGLKTYKESMDKSGAAP